MTAVEIINLAVVVIGIPTIAGVLINTGKKLKTLDVIEDDLKTNIRPDLKEVREKFFQLQGKLSNSFQANSPISLTDVGQGNLEKSGLKKYIDDHPDDLFSACSSTKKMENPYDIQTAVFEFFDEYTFPKEIEDQLKSYSFEQGLDLDILKRIGAIYFRDICLNKKGHKVADLDRPNA